MNVSMEIKLDFKIVDFHGHFPISSDNWLKPYEDEYIKENGFEKYEYIKLKSEEINSKWLKAWSFPDAEKPLDDLEEIANRWIKELDTCNVEKIAFLTSGGNENAIKLFKKFGDRFILFAHHLITDEDASEKLVYAAKNGLTGYKILAPLIKQPLDDPNFNKVFEVCEQYKMPVVIHFGILGGGGIGGGVNINPIIIHNVAKRFPKVDFIIPHFGCGYVRELLQLMWACHNVYVDTSGNNEWIRFMPYELTLKDLFRKFYENFGPCRIIYGSDSEWFPRGYAIRYLLDQLRACYEIGIKDFDIKKIFRENALNFICKRG